HGFGPTSVSAANVDDLAGLAGHPVKVNPIRKAKAGKPDASGQFKCQNEGAAVTCYGPWQMRNAYNVQPLIDKGYDGKGSTIVIVDAYGSPTAAQDLALFNQVFKLRSSSFKVIAPFGVPTFDPTDNNMIGWA